MAVSVSRQLETKQVKRIAGPPLFVIDNKSTNYILAATLFFHERITSQPFQTSHQNVSKCFLSGH